MTYRVLVAERVPWSPRHAAARLVVRTVSTHVLARDAHREAARVRGWVG